MNRRRPAKRQHPGCKQLSCWVAAGIVDRLVAHVGALPGRQQRQVVEAALDQYLARAAPAAADG